MFGRVLAVSMVAALVAVAACDDDGSDSALTSTTGLAPAVSPTTRSPDLAETISGALAELLETDAVLRIIDDEGGRDPESDPLREIVVASAIGGDTDRPVEANVVGLLEFGGRVARFTDDPDAEIAELEEVGTTDIAVVVIDDLRVDGERAEIDVHLWCGNACDVALTYEAEMGPERFMITGVAD
jgi:hypothetical protein